MKWETAGMVILLTLPLAFGVACSKQAGVITSESGAENSQSLPFDGNTGGRGFSPTAALPPAGIPAGTLLTVRLRSSLSSATARAGDQFTAILAEPVVIGSETVVPDGSAVTGKVLAAAAAGRSHEPGYLRLILTSVSLQGKSLRLQTASIFMKGREARGLMLTGSRASGSLDPYPAVQEQDVEFSPDREITFRLTEPLAVQN